MPESLYAPAISRESLDPKALWPTHYEVMPNGCWRFLGGQYPSGYGRATFRGKKGYAHRLMYRLLVGPIPAGMTIDHLCVYRLCVNPSHMEVFTHGENARRARLRMNEARNLCGKGLHAWDENKKQHASGWRCEVCWKEYMRDYNKARRTAS